MQSQELVPIQDRPNLYLDTAQPRVPQDFWHCSAADLLHFLYLCLAFEPLILLEEEERARTAHYPNWKSEGH